MDYVGQLEKVLGRDLLRMKKNNNVKFVIVSPRQRNSGGAVVLHEMCRRLCLMGYDAKIYYIEYFNYGNGNIIQWIKYTIKKILFLAGDTILIILVGIVGKEKLKKYNFFNGYAYYQVKDCKRKFIPRVGDNTIVIYPEVVRGNILHAKNVVRWFLYKNLYLKEEGDFNSKDLFITYRDIFNDWKLNPNGNRVYVSYFDRNLYRQVNFQNREGNCYIIRKGVNRNDLPKKYDGAVIDNYSELKKVEEFNKCKFCYSYDTQTTYAKIAALCGCIPIIMTENNKTRKDYLMGDDKGYGVAYGNTSEEIEYAINTRKELEKEFDRRDKKNEENICNFIEYCKQYFNNLPWK